MGPVSGAVQIYLGNLVFLRGADWMLWPEIELMIGRRVQLIVYGTWDDNGIEILASTENRPLS